MLANRITGYLDLDITIKDPFCYVRESLSLLICKIINAGRDRKSNLASPCPPDLIDRYGLVNLNIYDSQCSDNK
jgi:hypothetical protein